ncbi:MAG: response regulator [Myxacorys californica WJT36-NPBG1]|jgi:signal transduction histidine kinase/ActR/RegA family two-component response regulator|nr:response regulator [Myxacorys californica WJT36-NPBG1]
MSKPQQSPAGRLALLTVELRFEQDVVLARQRARQIASRLGFDLQQQTRIATAISEIARNALSYAGGGKVEFAISAERNSEGTDGSLTQPIAGQAPQAFLMRVSDSGPGIDQLSAIFDGRYQSSTGMGLGLIGAKRLMDDLKIQSVCVSSGDAKRGTIVELIKYLPKQTPHLTPKDVQQIVDHLLRDHPQDAYAELHQQNQELLHTLDALRQRQDDLAQLNQELEATNRGVVALYAELNDRAESFQQASELKSRFLSHLSHEFRTPLNGILGLSSMLLRRLDGELSAEQEKQVTFIRRSATALSDLVNDLLDLAKVESGKSEVNVAPFEVADLFSTLLGMLRPLLDQNETVQLVFDDAMNDTTKSSGSPTLYTDEGKVSQILRNLLSNALKFTEQGEVRVSATLGNNQTIIFTVADTGIGLAATDQTRIFEEFVQVNHLLQRRVKGTGLGLPLCRKLAALLGGSVALDSTVGVGSKFILTLPISYSDSTSTALDVSTVRSKPDPSSERADDVEPKPELIADQPPRSTVPRSDADSKKKILLIDDDKVSRYTLISSLADFYTVIEAKDGYEGLYRARTQQPNAIVLDLSMPRLDGFEVLAELKADPLTQAIPVIILSSNALTATQAEDLATHTIALLSKQTDSPQMLLQLQEALLSVGLDCH